MKPFTLTALIIAVAGSALGGDSEFRLGLESLRLSDLDPRTEARLATWNSPTGRVMNHARQMQADIQGGGQPGGPPGALAFRVKVQRGFPPRVVAATSVAGIELYERSVEVIRWPWRKSDAPALSLEEQLSLMLGERLRRGVGAP